MAALAPASPSVGAPRPFTPWIWRVQALLSAYLPVLLMAFLASGTWWLVKNTPMAEGPMVAVPPRHLPDYEMKNFELQRVGKDGLLRVQIEGTALRHYPDTDTLEIDGIRLRAIGADGSLTLSTARRALANADATDLQLSGDVLVQQFAVNAQGEPLAKPKLEVRGQFLQALSNSEQLQSHLPVQLNYSGGTVQALGFEYDHLRGLLSFTGHTTGRFDAPVKRASKASSK